MAFSSVISGLLRRGPAAAEPSQSGGDGRQGITSYPAVDPGFGATKVEDLVAANDELLQRLKLAYGATKGEFERDILDLVGRYAEYVHELPATPDNYFNGPGGLLRMGLETAFFALQATDGQIFSGRTTIEKRHKLEPRWRLATFIAGLCSEVHRTLSHVMVADANGNVWPGYLMPLGRWLADGKVERYYLRWIPNGGDMRALGVFALRHIVPGEVLQQLAEQNSVVVPHMMACITGLPVYREHNVLEELVRRAAAVVIDRDLRARADRYGQPQIGSHLERYLVDALRRLVSGHSAWRPNAAKSRVWFDRVGLYVVWPNGAADIRKLLDDDCLAGIPKAPETILEILVDAGVIEVRDEAHATWTLFPPESESSIEAVKLSSPMIVLGGIENPPPPLPVDLRTARGAPAAGAGHQSNDGRGQKRAAATRLSKPSPEPSSQLELGVGGSESPSSLAQPEEPAGESSAFPGVVADAEEMRSAEGTRTAEETPRVQFALRAPLRLSPTVRAAAEALVATMNDGREASVRTTPEGVFVPITALEAKGLDPALAIRALTDCRMLVAGREAGATVVRDFGGAEVCGIVIAPQFVSGLDVRDFLAAAGPETTC